MRHNDEILIKAALQAEHVRKGEVIQPLWSGYGEVYRAIVSGAIVPSVIVKHINPRLHDGSHPRGWHSNISVARKLESYRVEQYWYKHYAPLCDIHCKVPDCYASDRHKDERLIVLEDLDHTGYPCRYNHLSAEQCIPCLAWLARFHALFINTDPEGLWSVGTYWHLATRQQEWHACVDPELKYHAKKLDELLSNGRYQTLVHGDAKVANFCFSEEGSEMGVAAVDFQYVGGGCGIRDVAYFLGSCLSDHECQRSADYLLDRYFALLQQACKDRSDPIVGQEFQAVEKEWRGLYPIAWADFHRFLAGWSPDHHKINDYARLQTRIALDAIG